jgi:hypothetical protein
LARFFRGPFASILLNKFARALVLISFGLYLVIATSSLHIFVANLQILSAWGCLNIRLGLEPFDLLPQDSYGKRALRVVEQYFPGLIVYQCSHNHQHYQ